MTGPVAPLWHYTVGTKLPLIRKSGALLPIPTPGAPATERPVVWLSRRPVFEPTARKGWGNAAGQVRTLTMRETHDLAGGLFRFKIHPDFPVEDLDGFRLTSGISRHEFRALVTVGKRQGANPSDWFISYLPIPLESTESLEAWDGQRWIDVEPVSR